MKLSAKEKNWVIVLLRTLLNLTGIQAKEAIK